MAIPENMHESNIVKTEWVTFKNINEYAYIFICRYYIHAIEMGEDLEFVREQ